MNLPEGKKIINTRWVFKLKKDSHNVPVRFKARLVAKGYSQEKGIIYNCIYRCFLCFTFFQ